MIMVDLAQHSDHGLLQHLKALFGEANGENSIAQNRKNTGVP